MRRGRRGRFVVKPTESIAGSSWATVDIRLVQIYKVMVADLPMEKPARVFSACGTERQSSPYFSIHDCGSVPKLSSQSLKRRSDQSRPSTSFR